MSRSARNSGRPRTTTAAMREAWRRKGLFVDTAGWMACADGADPLHARSCTARDAALESGALLVTTDLVIDETLTLIRLRIGLAAAETWWRHIDGSRRVRWERIDAERFENAFSVVPPGRARAVRTKR